MHPESWLTCAPAAYCSLEGLDCLGMQPATPTNMGSSMDDQPQSSPLKMALRSARITVLWE
ncbi:hypothetical protein [Pseudomonas chlororaphis]|uniref:hypothetical protein n=1 Tax=Pseudomonas chlororaphis TaxID=587753 RepID=UPI0004714C6E|nr:hypothetical protein [Pseudomonas chlororaphis]